MFDMKKLENNVGGLRNQNRAAIFGREGKHFMSRKHQQKDYKDINPDNK
jgi:hypothetical protein